MDHVITEKSGGNGWTVWADAICTCGWHGKRLWGINNPSWYDFKREQADHIADAARTATIESTSATLKESK